MSTSKKPRVVLVGPPNVGKSAIFGALTGTYVTVSNYPGTTVEITRGELAHAEGAIELVDTPGTNHLVPMSEDELVTRDVLLVDPPDLLVQVGDAKNLTRTLLLTFQLLDLGIPMVLDLNMVDEARARGPLIDTEKLSTELGIPIRFTAATQKEGTDALRQQISDLVHTPSTRKPASLVEFRASVEEALGRVEQAIGGDSAKKRALALMLLCGERSRQGALVELTPPEAFEVADRERALLEQEGNTALFAQLSRERLVRAQSLVRTCMGLGTSPAREISTTRARLDFTKALPVGLVGALACALVVDSALAHFSSGVRPLDPLADFGTLDVVARALSTDIFRGWSREGLGIFALFSLLGVCIARVQSRMVEGLWKMALSFAVGYGIYVLVAMGEALTRGVYSSMPIYAGGAAGMATGLGILFARGGDYFFSRRLGALATHPFWGLPILCVVLFYAYKIVGVFGAGTAVDLLENRVFGSVSAEVSLTDATDRSSLSDDDGSSEGAERILVDIDRSSQMRTVTAQTKTDGHYVDATKPRLDVYPKSVRILQQDGAKFVVEVPRGAAAEARIWTGHINRAAYGLLEALGWSFLTAFIVGKYGLLTMGLTYAVAIVLPVVATFFFVFSMLEDSGYLPRLAVMANRMLRGIGLNGKAVLPMVLGLGCDTMATLTARIMETKKERVLVTLLLALGIPCSSQLSVVFAMMQRTSRVASVVWLLVVMLTIAIVGYVSAKIIPGDRSDFLLEMPPIRRPMLRNLATKTMARVEWYLREAAPLFLIGTALLFVHDRFSLLTYVHKAGEPIVHHLLGFSRAGGVSDRVSEALLVGFLRRDFGAAGLLAMTRGGRLSPADVAVSMVTITLFIPCIANVFMIVKERGAKVALAMCAFIFPYAVLVGAAVRVLFRLVGT